MKEVKKNDIPKCFVQNIDDTSMHSNLMDCTTALKKAREGCWGRNWQLVEFIVRGAGYPSVLRIIGRSIKGEDFKLLHVDPDFESYYEGIKEKVPESMALQYFVENI